MQRSVLLVDDEANIALSLEFAMTRAGYAVRTAADGEAALAAAQAERPDCVLLDVMMPKLNGYEVCRRLRADPAFSDVAIVMLTAKGGAVEGEKALALGADAFFAKPFSMAEVKRRVAELIGEAQP
ncbi:MAG: response regulator [Pseudomonadota bacterium]